MADEQKPVDQGEAPAHEDAMDAPQNVQTLTDLFDQLDRAAFKRVLEYRDSFLTPRKPAESG